MKSRWYKWRNVWAAGYGRWQFVFADLEIAKEAAYENWDGIRQPQIKAIARPPQAWLQQERARTLRQIAGLQDYYEALRKTR